MAAKLTIIEHVERWLEENGGASAAYLMCPPGRYSLLLVARPLGQRDEGLIEAVAELEDELDWEGHDVSAFVLEAGDERDMAEALNCPGCVAIFRRPPRAAA